MSARHWGPVLAALALCSAPSSGADLTKIDRKIAKEPAYESKPKYCLVVFGPEAGTRVWLVLDGESLYIDKNANGDLTEEGERFYCRRDPGGGGPNYPFAEIRHFNIADQIPTNGAGKYTRFGVVHTTIKKDFTPNNRDDRELKALFSKDPTLTRIGTSVCLNGNVEMQGVALCADRPADAPIIHFDGPLTMAPLLKQEIQRGDKPQELNFCVGTKGLGRDERDAFAILYYPNIIPDAVNPTAEFEFAGRRPGEKPLRVELALKRC